MQTIDLPSGASVTVSGQLTPADKAALSRALGLERASPVFRSYTDSEGNRGLEIALAGAPREAARPALDPEDEAGPVPEGGGQF